MAVALGNSLFIHIPKTGGTWVTRVLNNSFPNSVDISVTVPEEIGGFNMSAEHVGPDDIPRKYSHLKCFAFIRHPFEWYRSFWAYRMKDSDRWTDPRFILDKCGDDNFSVFLENVLRDFPKGFVSELYKRYTKDVRVGKQENLTEDLLGFLDEFESDYDKNYIKNFSRINESKNQYKDAAVCSDSLKKKVLKAEKWAIEEFNY